MQKRNGLLLAAALVLVIPSAAAAQQSLRWQPTLEAAKTLAAQTNRLVLIHFWAEWCGSCRRMEQEVFSLPEVAAAVHAHYVPVKVNSDHFPATRQQYGVTTLPADVIITPQGQLVDRLQGLPAAAQYVARLNQVAAATQLRPADPYGGHWQTPAPPVTRQFAGPPTAGSSPSNPLPSGQLPSSQSPSGQPSSSQSPLGQLPSSQSPSGQPSSSQSPSGQPLWDPPPSSRPPQGNPPLGLDGYCPVQLYDDMMSGKLRWVLGNRLWGAVHRGRTYLFAGPQQQQRFLAEPDRYAPVFSGNDVVAAIEQGQTLPGYREHGVFFGNQIYLFANEANLERFRRNPDHYANAVLQAMRSATAPR